MNTKPSEKIKEIALKLEAERNTDTFIYYGKLDAIVQYLDDEWEKKHNHDTGMICEECRRSN